MPFFETSVINNTNVDQAFMNLVQDIKVRLELEAKDQNRPVKGEVSKAKKSSNTNTKKLTDTKKKSSSWC